MFGQGLGVKPSGCDAVHLLHGSVGWLPTQDQLFYIFFLNAELHEGSFKNFEFSPILKPLEAHREHVLVLSRLNNEPAKAILGEGQGDVGTAMLPGPEGQWAMPKEMVRKLPGYDPDVAKSRAEAQKIMQSLGYGPEKRLSVKIASRNIPDYRDAASIVSDQLKHIYIDAELELVETANWLPKLVRGDFVMAQSVAGAGIDDPDQTFYENYGCKSNRNYTKYCDPEVEKLVDQQSMETDIEKRRRIVWEMDRRLQEAVARPILYYMRKATCTRPEVKGLTVMANSSYNGWRMEDVWLDK